MVNSENIYVQFDYNNIFVVDPNKVVTDEGVKNRMLKHEELTIYANLSCKVVPRTKLILGMQGETQGIVNLNIAEINFLKPGNKPFLDTSWTEYGGNKDIPELVKLDKIGNNATNPGDINGYTSLLGILSISIQIGSSVGANAVVAIEMEDIRGRALFEAGANSPYSAFFSYPYPMFSLTLKGYLGKAIKYDLQLNSFSARFNAQTGNFTISTVFYTYRFSIFNELQSYILFAVPYMYKTSYLVGETSNQNNQTQAAISQTSSNSTPTTNAKTITTSKGRQKITEVYTDYKSKGLIDDNFPDLTVPEFLQKLEVVEQNIQDNFNKVEMSALSDLESYSKNLQELIDKVESSKTSWITTWLDTKNFFVLKDDNGTGNKIVYPLLKNKNDSQSAENARAELDKLFKEYNAKLNNNPTCGQNGSYMAGNTKVNSPIVSEFTYTKVESELQVSDIDWDQTFRSQTGKASNGNINQADLEKFTENISQTIFNTNFTEKDGTTKPKTYFYNLYQKGGYIEQKSSIQKSFDKIKQDIESEYTKILAEKLQNPNENGLGFIPTIRNVLAIFIASTEAYLRLMDDVHRLAWDQRMNTVRKGAISSGSPDDLKSKFNAGYPVYPWPSYIIETNDKNTKYQQRYPGESEFLSKTEAFRYDIWPEVEFIEELLRAIVQKDPSQPESKQPSNELQYPNRISLNVIEYPITNSVYSNQQISKYFYEIWERTFIASFYQGLNRGSGNNEEVFDIVAGAEVDNILTSLGTTNPSLIQILKGYKFDETNIVDVLRHYSNDGTGESWQLFIRNNFVTPYIKNRIDNEFVLFSNRQIFEESTIPAKNLKNVDKVKRLLLSTTSNNIEFTDTYPFTNTTWLRKNVQNGISITNQLFSKTNKIIEYNEEKKVFANFQKSTDSKTKRPITQFNYVSPNSLTTQFLKTYYQDRKITEQYPTEGTITYQNYNAELIAKQSISILNTPYFINSIISGVTKFQQFDPAPFTNSAFLFLNSLPLITLREKYKTNDSSNSNYEDYISATLRKFAALHKLPYAWVLKYGSIWWRYKKWINSGKTVDPVIVDWTSFDYPYNYDPVTSDQTKQYTFNIPYPDGSLSSTTVTLQNDFIDVLNSERHTTICSGFYPNTINQFNLFLQGLYVFNFTYTNTDIQNGINNYKLYVIPGTNTSNLYYGTFSKFDSLFTATTYTARTLSYKTYSTYIEDIRDSKNVFILPSFGSNVNQCQQECFSYLNDYQTMKTELFGNQSLFDGSIRGFWNAPHFGYFDHTKIAIPKPNEYLKQIYYNQDEQENFSLVFSGYTDISEIFSVFDKEMLDIFEAEFLKFSKSAYDFTSPDGLSSSEKIYYNFQLLTRELMKVPKPIGQNFESIINELQGYQLKTISSTIQGFLEHDILIKQGNPANFDRRMFYSLSSKPVENRYTYNSYAGNSPNAVPYSGSFVTLLTSQTNFPNEWNALELHVGYSTIPELIYKDTGSYITDFFVEMNVEFTVNNITNFSDLIKIYATQKLIDNSVTGNTFVQKLDEFLTKNEEFHGRIITSLFTKLQTQLPDVTITETKIPSTIDGSITRLDAYYAHKALNDKWVSGIDFSFKTFFEDFLFLDSANRDIGDVLMIDIYNLANKRKFYENQQTITSVVMSITTPLKLPFTFSPGYVNYYGIQEPIKDAIPKPESAIDLANTLFGTFLSVDTTQSRPKWIFMLPSNSSDHLKTDDFNTPFNDDGMFLVKPDNPAVEDQKDKKDWAFSNKVIGFEVNFGVQNQNVFTNMSVDMDSNKASMDSIQRTVDMVTNDYKKTNAQTTALLNFYQNRSYSCEVTMLGNVLIQPGMWFNLNHVPLFAGSYRIMSVSHKIGPGFFETNFIGMRNKIYSYPLKYDYLQSVNKNVLQKVQSKLPKTESSENTQPTNVLAQTNDKVANVENEKVPVGIDECSPISYYNRFVVVDEVQSKTTISEMINTINSFANRQSTQRETLSKVMFSIIYIESSDNIGSELVAYNNNYAGVRLTKEWGQVGKTYFDDGKFICLKGNLDQINRPYAVFKSLDDNLEFLYSNMRVRIATMVGTTYQDIAKLYVDFWQNTQSIYDSMTLDQKITIENKVQTALTLWSSNQTIPSPTPQTTIFDVNYGVFGSISVTELMLIKVNIKPNVGNWKIVLREGEILQKSDSPPCQTTGTLSSPGSILSNGQIFEYSAEDLLFDSACDDASGNDAKGTIYFRIVVIADPIDSNGNLDTTRKQYSERFESSYQLS